MERVFEYSYNGEPVELMGIFQYSQVIDPSPLIGGHSGGVVAYAIAVIRFKDLTLKSVLIGDIIPSKETDK